MKIEEVGTSIDKIPVEISYRIIELFSAGLYSSPNKAFEELVSNSYDAEATKVSVYVPTDKKLSSSLIWIADNGKSMGRLELKGFWKIGESTKRISQNGRLPIGKFGIGKLATYILTNKLTLICKAADQKYYAVTMDYSSINQDTKSVSLDEKELTLDEVKSILNPLIKINDQNLMSFDLWGDQAVDTWTFVIMTNLKPKATEIKEKRLQWVLSTALPLNPNFNLFFNGAPLESSKLTISPWKTWEFGVDEDIVNSKKFSFEAVVHNGKPAINLSNLKNVSGKIDLYRDLLSGKSDDWGRSNGIFLNIRGRLINLDDPLMGIEALSHAVFNRIRITINADELDSYITSARENIQASEALEDLKAYLRRKFSKVKDWYYESIDKEEKSNQASHKIANASGSLTRRPIVLVTKKILDGKLDDLILTSIPSNLPANDKEALITRLEEDLLSEEGIIKKVEWVTLQPEEPIAKLDIQTGVARINMMHPFFANFIDDVKSPLPFQLIALTEILSEFIMLESGMDQSAVKSVILKRDQILRDLTFSDKPNAPLVASLLGATLNNSQGLEDSVSKAFTSLGFETTPIGGSGTPDGKAVAHLGPINSDQNYSVTYDAKSTSKEKIKATTAHISGVDRHRDQFKSDYACVVAIDFEGADVPNSAVNVEAKKHKINLIRAKDLMTLVLLSSPKQLGLKQLRDFFENNHTVIETSKWIQNLREVEVKHGPVKELLEEASKLNKTDTEPASLYALRMKNEILNKHSIEELKSLTQSIARLVPNYLSISSDNIVNLNSTPDKIMAAINHSYVSEVPLEFREMYIKAFSGK